MSGCIEMNEQFEHVAVASRVYDPVIRLFGLIALQSAPPVDRGGRNPH